MCVAAFIYLVQKFPPFRDDHTSLTDMFVWLPILTDIVFVRQDAKKDRAPRWRSIVDGFSFQVTAELQKMPIDNSASIGIRRWCVCVDSTLLYLRFFFFHFVMCFFFGRIHLVVFFVKCVAGLATNLPVKEKFVTKKVDIRDPPTPRLMAAAQVVRRLATFRGPLLGSCRALGLATSVRVSLLTRSV